jgi:hypothetical protein
MKETTTIGIDIAKRIFCAARSVSKLAEEGAAIEVLT